MNENFKPAGYSSVSPYFVIDGAEKFIHLMREIFNATELRKYKRPDGKIAHAELQIDDSVIMFCDSTERFPPLPIMIHVYLPNVDETFSKAVNAGCEVIEEPKVNEGDPDKRGSFKDFGGNMWSISTQVNDNK